MKGHINTPVPNKNVGQILSARRRELNAPLSDAVSATRIRKEYLEALERNDYSVFASEVYIRGFLRNYASYLGLNPESVLAIYRREVPAAASRQSTHSTAPKAQYTSPALRFSRKGVLGSLAILTALMAGAYFLYTAQSLLQPPELTVSSPESLASGFDGEIFVSGQTVSFSGTTSQQNVLRLNSEAIEVAPDKTFTTRDLPVPEDGAYFVISTTNQFGRVSSIKVKVRRGGEGIAESGKAVIMIESVNKPGSIKVVLDGKEDFNDRMFPGDRLNLDAHSYLVLTSSTPENFKVTINGNLQTFNSNEQRWELEPLLSL